MDFITEYAVYIPIILVAVSQYAAVAGKPKLIEKIAMISDIWDFIAGNYLKAKNR